MMFLFYVCSIWTLVLAHVFYRSQGFLGMRGRPRLAMGVGFFLIGFAYIPARILIEVEPASRVAAILTLGAAFIVGLVSILWTLLVPLESTAALVWLVARRRLKNTSRRMRGTLAALWWAAAIVLAAVGVLAALDAPSMTRLQVSIPTVDRDGAEPFRLIVISDTHLGAISSIAQWRRTLEAAHIHDPHALIVAGDLIDDSTPRAVEQAAMIREFFPDEPVYAVTGNHERYAGLEFFERLCQEYRFKRLRGASEPIRPGLFIAGIDDSRGDAAQPPVAKALSGADGALLFITHRPEAARFLSERPMALAVAGHTHGGQIPPMTFLTALDNGGFSAGHYRVGKAHLYVSRGAGVWGPPMRLLAPSEIVLVEVSAGAEFKVSTGAP